ncbi:MAG: signal recognition particle-docking protein FtsY [Desulfobacteraceae bacterium]|nr:MAG: signal recognition particle-docking protein FtsY [Desulfobacteraceae bacterium]
MAFDWFKKKNKPDTSEKRPSADISSEPAVEERIGIQKQAGTGSGLDLRDTESDSGQDQLTSSSNKGFLARLKRGLTKTRDFLNTDIEDLFRGKNRIDDEMLEEIEELLVTADIGIQTVMDLMDSIGRKASKVEGPEALKQLLKEEILALFNRETAVPRPSAFQKPFISMVVGVNGVGKTTTIGKLAAKDVQAGQKVLIAAADTFRAAAAEQLAIWADRAGADFLRRKDNADPAAVAYDSVEAALARGIDRVYIDTAGRLHTKINLMEELKKIQRTIQKKIPDAPHEILLVLDATTGQNAISQAKLFHESLGITGLALTKLDGTAKGGIVISICRQMKLPLLYIGVGETIEDLQSFDAKHFVDALF